MNATVDLTNSFDNQNDQSCYPQWFHIRREKNKAAGQTIQGSHGLLYWMSDPPKTTLLGQQSEKFPDSEKWSKFVWQFKKPVYPLEIQSVIKQLDPVRVDIVLGGTRTDTVKLVYIIPLCIDLSLGLTEWSDEKKVRSTGTRDILTVLISEEPRDTCCAGFRDKLLISSHLVCRKRKPF